MIISNHFTMLLPTPSLHSVSPSSVAALISRGGAASVQDAALTSYYGDALGYFGGIRIPASFFAGTSLAAIFLFKNVMDEGSYTPMERRVVKFYHLMSLLTFILSLNTTVFATMAGTSVLHGGFDTFAESAYKLLVREFEFEFGAFLSCLLMAYYGTILWNCTNFHLSLDLYIQLLVGGHLLPA
jgi:hypothetical protein